jgi:6-phosphogluconate dehydrogenase
MDAATGKPFVDIVPRSGRAEGNPGGPCRARPGVPDHRYRRGDIARSLSAHAGAAGAARNAFGSETDSLPADRANFTDDVRKALYASKVVAYAQGFDQIQAGSDEYDWHIDRGAMATIWRGGCIIRARFLDRVREAYDLDPALPSLLVAPYFAEAVSAGVQSWRRIVADAAIAGVPAPAFASSLAYYDGLRKDRLPAALIQGLRDNFGAHTYRRVDREGTFHTPGPTTARRPRLTRDVWPKTGRGRRLKPGLTWSAACARSAAARSARCRRRRSRRRR